MERDDDKEASRRDVVRAIRESKNLREAAKKLDMPRRTLQRRMREYGIPRGRAGRPKRKFRYRGKSRASIALGAAALAVGAFVVGRKFRSRGGQA